MTLQTSTARRSRLARQGELGFIRATLPADHRRGPPLTVLSYSAGQDSTCILYLLGEFPWFRERYAPNEILVIAADTGDEHDVAPAGYVSTYEQYQIAEDYCRAKRIPFEYCTADRGFHSTAWSSLQGQFDRNSTVGSKAGFRKSCTTNLKIEVIYRALEAYLGTRYGLASGRGKPAIRAFGAECGPIPMMIGIAADEPHRAATAPTGKPWFDDNIDRTYPLLDLGIDREAATDVIRALGKPVPMPSLCRRCFAKSPLWILWTRRRMPEMFADWERQEAAKLARFADRPVNHTVFGDGRTLTRVADDAEDEYAHLSFQEIEEIIATHGHAVCSTY